MSNNPNFNNMFNAQQNMNYNDQAFPSMGNQQQQQPQGYQPYGQQIQGGFPPQGQFVQQQPQGFPGQNPFPAPQAAPVQAPAAATGAPAANPFANSNPFAAKPAGESTGAFNPFASGGVKEFKPKVAKGIMDDDDDAPVDFGSLGVSKKKKKTAEELAAEKAKAQAEADAALPTKGKPSSFFVMDFVQGDARDPTGQMRVPTQEQTIFIFANYPTNSAPHEMILKLYELYDFAFRLEQAKEAEKNLYKKPKKQVQEVEYTEDVILEDEDTTFGSGFGKQNKKNQKKRDEQAAAEKDSKKVIVKKTKAQTEAREEQAQKKVSVAVKDINVVPDEDVVDVDETRQPASFVFIGHVDAGKSTICGNLIYSMGIVDQRTIDKFKKEAKDKGRDSWWLAYVMDSSDEEKAKGKTVEMGRAVIDTKSKSYTIFDAPGHKNYVPNMIMGATLADFGGLVISARRGEFEAGFDQEGQTREHIQLARSLGISKLVVVVNKMDEATVSWKKQRWDDIRAKITPFLNNCGYSNDDLFWVPISGLTGQNIVEPVDDSVCSWYDGPTLLDILDNMPLDVRNAEAPLRIPVLDKMRESNKSVIFGKVEQGTVRLGDRLALSPQNMPCQVLGLVNDKQQQVMYARPGDNIQLKISNLDEDQIFKGDVLCPRDNPMQISQVLEVELELLELLKPIFSKGSQCMMHIHTWADEVFIKDIIWAKEKDPATSQEVKKEKPKFTRSFAKCLVRIGINRPIPVEKMADCAALGRFTLRDEGRTIAVGRVQRYVPANKTILKPSESSAGATDSAANPGAADKVAPVVFNLETGKAEEVPKPLAGVAEEDEKEDD